MNNENCSTLNAHSILHGRISMSPVLRNLFGVSEESRHKPRLTVTEDSKRLEIFACIIQHLYLQREDAL